MFIHAHPSIVSDGANLEQVHLVENLRQRQFAILVSRAEDREDMKHITIVWLIILIYTLNKLLARNALLNPAILQSGNRKPYHTGKIPIP